MHKQLTLKRWMAVFSTYWSRPVNVVSSAIGILVACFIVVISQESAYFSSILPKPGFWDGSRLIVNWRSYPDHVEEGVAKGDVQTAVKWDWDQFDHDADRLFVFEIAELPWEKIAAMPNLKQLDLGYVTSLPVSDAIDRNRQRFERIEGLQSLTQLTLLDMPAVRLDQSETSIFAELQNLEWLGLANVELEDGLPSLPVLPKLRFLSIRSADLLTRDAIEHLTSFPNLQTLAIAENRTPKQRTKAPEEPMVVSNDIETKISRLAQLSNLRKLYVAGREFSNLEDIAISALPKIRVNPSLVNVNQSIQLPFVLIACMIFVSPAILGFITSFSRPDTKLVPQYGKPHLLIPSLLLLPAILVGTYLLHLIGADWINASCLSVGSVGLFVSFFLPRRRQLLPVLALVLVIVMMVARNSTFQLLVRDLFHGNLRGIALLYAVTGVVAFAWYLKRMMDLCVSVSEYGNGVPIVSGVDWANELQARQKVASEKKRFLFGSQRRFDKNLEGATSTFHNQNAQNRQRLWMASGPPSGRLVMQALFLISLMIVGPVTVISYRGANVSSGVSAIESSIIFFLVSWSAWMILANQWQRRQFLAMELCRPIGRSDFLTDLFANLVKQFRLIPFIVVFVLVPSVLFRNPDFAAINQVLIYAVCALSLCVYWFGFGCNVLSMRNPWLIGIFSVVFLTMLVVCALSPYWYLEIFKRGQPAFPIVISSVFMSVSGIFMIMVSLRHWPNVELDPLRPQGY